MNMDITFYDIKVFLWNILTFGYLPHILFVVGVLFLFFNLFYLFSFYRIIKHSTKDKVFFFKFFVFHFIVQKYYFLKYYIDTSLDYYNRRKVFVILGTALIIVILTIYILIMFLKT